MMLNDRLDRLVGSMWKINRSVFMLESDVQLGVGALRSADFRTILSQVIGNSPLLPLPSRSTIVEHQLRRTG